jgi:hypothetical protein
MLLNDEAGCPGKRRVSGGSVGVCYSCSRYGKRSATAIEPAAKLGLDGVWQCDERRSTGVVLSSEQVAAMDEMAGHVANVRPDVDAGQTALLGGRSVARRTDEAA